MSMEDLSARSDRFVLHCPLAISKVKEVVGGDNDATVEHAFPFENGRVCGDNPTREWKGGRRECC